MKFVLYLMRHATADVRSSLEDEADRCLNEKGRLQARRVAAFMQKQSLVPDRIVSSPQTKALQTAALVRKDLGIKAAVEECPCLLPAVPAPEMKAFLELRKASLTCIELDSEAAIPARLAWSVPAKFM